jgi:3-dehydroquinate synthase
MACYPNRLRPPGTSRRAPAVMTIRINVRSERGTYPVVIGSGTTRMLPALLEERRIGSQRLVVSSAPVWRAQGRRLRDVLPPRERPVLMGVGERAKTLATVTSIYDACLQRRLDRSAAIVAFGGGVVGDTAGFAAASYLRGIGLVQVPTTLLSQVDSAIGGKVGVNLPAGKNLVGAFYSPSLVVCDPDVLVTLPRREFRAGLYEVVKYGVIASERLFTRVTRNLEALFAHDPDILSRVVADCCRIKARVVMSDERESGIRRILNFGHTIGHALEAITRYRRFLHGEAIGYGMLAAARLSTLRAAMSAEDERRLSAAIRALGKLPRIDDLRASDALDVIARDKKVVSGRLHFVLASGIGSTVIVSDVGAKELVHVMRSIGMR